LKMKMKEINKIKMKGNIKLKKRNEYFFKWLIWFGKCNLNNYLRKNI
jgi:hypothetical protein